MPILIPLPRAALLLALPLAAAGCGDIFGSELGRHRERLADARARWERQNVDTYGLTVSRHCFCGDTGPIVVHVVDGVIVSRVYSANGQPVPADRFTDIDTVDELFAFIEQGLDEDPHDADVTFDPRFGYPVDAYIDYSVSVSDEEDGFRVHDLSWPENP